MNETQAVDHYQPPGGGVEAYQSPPVGAITPAQARVEAVSTLLHAAYQRASTLILTPEQDQALSADFPDEAFKPGAAGKENLIYIEHAYLRDRFNQVFGRGQWTLMRTKPHWAEEFDITDKWNKTQRCTRIYAEAALLVKGCFVGEAIGEMVYYPNNSAQNYGDAAEGAMTAAFRRCAKNFGVGLQAWKKDFCEGWKQRNQGGAPKQYAPAPTQPRPAAPTQAPTPTPAPAPKPAPAQAPAAQAVGGATPKTREWMLAKLLGSFPETVLTGFAVDHKLLLAGEALANWPLPKVPTTGPGIRELMSKVQDWMAAQTGAAQAEDPDVPPAEDSAVPSSGDDWTQLPWASVIITVPNAGQKKPEYLQNPDTVGSLYTKSKQGDEAARKRLFGLAHGWQPQPWVSTTGQTYQPSANDLKAREALDQFMAWHEAKGEA